MGKRLKWFDERKRMNEWKKERKKYKRDKWQTVEKCEELLYILHEKLDQAWEHFGCMVLANAKANGIFYL